MLRTSGILHYGRFAGLRTPPFTNRQLSLFRPTRPHIPVRQTVTWRTLYTAMQKTLDFHAGPLVWIDCEMTGLDPRKDRILEIAVSQIQHVSMVHSNLTSL